MQHRTVCRTPLVERGILDIFPLPPEVSGDAVEWLRHAAPAGKKGTLRERRYSSKVRRTGHYLCLWRQVSDSLDEKRALGRNLRKLPPVLYRETEADGHRRTCGAFPEKIRQPRKEIIISSEISLRGRAKARPFSLSVHFTATSVCI